MKAKELFELLKPLFKEDRITYEELRYEGCPEWNKDVVLITGFHTCYHDLSDDVKDLRIEFNPNEDKITEFGFD